MDRRYEHSHKINSFFGLIRDSYDFNHKTNPAIRAFYHKFSLRTTLLFLLGYLIISKLSKRMFNRSMYRKDLIAGNIELRRMLRFEILRVILRVIFIIILHGREKLIILNEKIPKVCRLENQIRKICRFPASPRINVYLLLLQ